MAIEFNVMGLNMKCPKCEIELEIMEREGHIGFCCSNCSGVLLTERYVSTLGFKPEGSILKLYADLEDGVINSSSCKCPSCKNEMHLSLYKNIELDFCSCCKAIWFDFNELNTSLTSQKSPEVGSLAYYNKRGIMSGILEVLGGILSNARH